MIPHFKAKYNKNEKKDEYFNIIKHKKYYTLKLI